MNMKKFAFSLMALALAGSMLFTSCHKDDDDDDDSSISELSATVNDGKFSTSTAAFYSSSSSANTGTSKITDILGASDGKTTIAGTKDGKQLAITIKGTTSGTYTLDVSANTTVNNALIQILSGGSVTDVISNAADVSTGAMIIYRTSNESEGGSTYYFSTKASVTFNLLTVYATGTFTAEMTNSQKDTFTISDGTFKVFGKPVTSAK